MKHFKATVMNLVTCFLLGVTLICPGVTQVQAQGLGLIAPGHVIGNGGTANPGEATDYSLQSVAGRACGTNGAFIVTESNVGQCSDSAGSTAILNGGPLTINPTAFSTTSGLVIAQSMPQTGSSSGSVFLNSITVSGDNLGGAVGPVGLIVNYNMGGTNVTRGRIALWAQAALNVSSPSLGNNGPLAIFANAAANVNAGGTNTGAGSSGAIAGLNVQAQLFNGATNFSSITGIETDCDIDSGATVKNRWCVAAVSSISVAGGAAAAANDAAFVVWAQTGAAGFTNALYFSNNGGGAPLSTSGCVICSDGTSWTIAKGIDLSSFTFTGNLLRGGGVTLDGAGTNTSTITSTNATALAIQTTGGANTAAVLNNGTAGKSVLWAYEDAGTVKWYAGKDTDNAFIINDNALGKTILRAPSNASGEVDFGVQNVITGLACIVGVTSGKVCQTVPAAAGTPTITWGSSSGTPAVTASGPLAITSATGNIACATCVTSAASLTANQVVIGSGSQGEQTLGTLGTTTTVLHGNAGGAPSFTAVVSADLNITTTTCTNQFITAISSTAIGTCTTATLASAQFANQGTTTTLLHGNAAGNPSFTAVVSADLNITTTTCTNQFVTAISSGGVGTCTTDTLASAQHANQGTTTTVLHGNAAGNPSWTAITLTTDVTGVLPVANGGTNCSSASITCFNNITGFSAAGTTGTTSTNLVFSTSPTLTTPSITTSATLSNNGIGAVSTDGFVIQNTTAAAAGAQQWSPRLHFIGQGWKTNATAASQTVDWIVEVKPTQQAANPGMNLVFSSQTNAAGFASRMELQDDGTGALVVPFTAASTKSVQFQLNITGTGQVGVFYADTSQVIVGSVAALPVLLKTGNATQAQWASGGGLTLFNIGAGAGNGAMCGATNIVNGTGGAMTFDSGANCIVSVREAKTNIEPLGDVLDEVMRMVPVEFRYRPGYGDEGAREQVGLVAQDVVAIDPRLGAYATDGTLTGVRYIQSVAIAFRAIQQLNDNLRAANDNLTGKVHRLEVDLKRLTAAR